MGLWIEIVNGTKVGSLANSQPLRWGCGLKFPVPLLLLREFRSASAMGLWIEITVTLPTAPCQTVSLCDGAVD